MSDKNALNDGEDSDHDELYAQKLETLQHNMTSKSDDITQHAAQSHDDGRWPKDSLLRLS